MSDLRWGYAINQWDGPRREQQERALKSMSVCGFRAVELEVGSGRFATLGRPELIELNFGSLKNFTDFLKACGVDQVASVFYDPGMVSQEEDSLGRNPANPAEHKGIVEALRPFAKFLHDVGGQCLVVRPMQSYWKEAPVTEAKIRCAAECWNTVGRMTKNDYGIATVLHPDFVCAIHTIDDIGTILNSTDPEFVGLAIDTAELTVAGVNPAEVYRRYQNRVRHFHFKDTRNVDHLGEYKRINADSELRADGGEKNVERWFWEMGTDGGLVDFRALTQTIRKNGYEGWIIVESDTSPHPAESVMLNAYYVKYFLDRA